MKTAMFSQTPVVVWMPGDVRTEIHLTAAQSVGALCLIVDEPSAGWALPPHRHRNEAETIHVIDGRFDLDVGGHGRVLGPGDTAHVPRGVIHSGANSGDDTGKRVVIFSPAGIEGFWLEIGKQQAGCEFDASEVLAAARRWGWDFPDA
jgi:quercetin dioxygenase-like cupin family protein